MKVFQETDTHILAPRHYLNLDEIDHQFVGPFDYPLLEDKCSLKPYDAIQEEALEFLGDYSDNPARADAIVNLRCGEGKTYIGIQEAFRYGYWTFAIAPTTDILNGWKDVLEEYTTLSKVGTVISGSFDLQPFTLALIDSVLALTEEQRRIIGETFGFILLDELHRFAAPGFSKAANAFPARRVGLTATLARDDYLSFVYYMALGNRIFYRQSSRKKANVLIKQVRVDDIQFPENYAKATTALATSDQYIERLEGDIRSDHAQGKPQLVLSSRREILYALRDRLQDLDVGVNDRFTKSAERHINLRTKMIILAIDTLAKMGLNEPRLVSLKIVTPLKDRNSLVQMVGRLERDTDEKDALATYYVPMYGPFIKTSQKTKAALTREGYRLEEEIDLGRN